MTETVFSKQYQLSVDMIMLETATVHNYYDFGIALKIPQKVMNEIRNTTPDVKEAKVKTISHYVHNTEKPTLKDVIHALYDIGSDNVANSIYDDYYGKFVSTNPL